MPFVKVNCKEELENQLKRNPELKKYVDEFNAEYQQSISAFKSGNQVKRRKREIAKARKLERKY